MTTCIYKVSKLIYDLSKKLSNSNFEIFSTTLNVQYQYNYAILISESAYSRNALLH